MRRSFLQLVATCACVSPLTWARAQSERTSSFDVLTTRALSTPKAPMAALLAITRAGRRLVAVGERGIVLLSDDDGKNWRQAEVPVSVTLTAVAFAGPKLGWATGHLGVVLHTEDGGTNWALQLDGIRAAELAFKAEQEVGIERGSARSLVADGPDKPLLDLYIKNGRVAWAVGAYNLAFRTGDGGETWHSMMDRLPNPKGLHLYAIRAVGNTVYIAGEQGLLMRSTDDGEHFELLPSPSKGTNFGMLVGERDELLLYGLRGRAFLSVDNATTWTEVNTGTRASLCAGLVLSDGAMLLASQAGELLLSRDGGRIFKPASTRNAMPITALIQAEVGKLATTSLRGIHKLDFAAAFT